MKRIFLYLFLLPCTVIAQNRSSDMENPNLLKKIKYRLIAEDTAAPGIKLPFSSIKIIDTRYDTTKIGFLFRPPVISLFKSNHFRIASMKNGLSTSAEKYYNDYYTNNFTNNDFHLLIVIKKFWFSNFSTKNNKDLDFMLVNSGVVSLRLKWEYYLFKNDEYLPVKRIDTSYNYTEELIKEMENEEGNENTLKDMKFFMRRLVEGVNFLNAIESFENKPKKTLAQINEFNNRRFLVPVLTNGGFQKGVYLSFKEFAAAKPQIENFTEKKFKYTPGKSDYYLQDNSGNDINTYWGYSDGDLFRLGKYAKAKFYKVGNTFDFFIKAKVTYTYQYETGAKSLYDYDMWVPFQLDMETGEIY